MGRSNGGNIGMISTTLQSLLCSRTYQLWHNVEIIQAKLLKIKLDDDANTAEYQRWSNTQKWYDAVNTLKSPWVYCNSAWHTTACGCSEKELGAKRTIFFTIGPYHDFEIDLHISWYSSSHDLSRNLRIHMPAHTFETLLLCVVYSPDILLKRARKLQTECLALSSFFV